MRCHGYGEGCECGRCLDQRMEDQHRWEEHQRQAEQEQYDEWARNQEEAYWASEVQAAQERREAVQSWNHPETEEPF